MTPEQLAEYQNYLDILSSNASIAQTINFEKEFALKQQKIEIAIKYIINGFPNEVIKIGTDFTDNEIDNLRNKLNDNK